MMPRRFTLALILVLAALPPAVFAYTRQSMGSRHGLIVRPVAWFFPAASGSELSNVPQRTMPQWQQYLAVAAGFGVKPLYMALSLVPLWLLRRQRSPDLVALRWCCVFFFAGEAFCAANYLGFAEQSYVMEYLHSLGMTLAFAAGIYAVTELIDIRLIRFSGAEGCRLGSLCGGCVQRGMQGACGVRRLLQLSLPVLMLVAAIPLASSYHLESHFSTILGTRYLYIHEWPYQQYEIRFLPAAAIGLFAAAWVVAGREAHPLLFARLLVAGGMGAMGFSLFRWVLLSAFWDNQLWFTVWEELTELGAVCLLLSLLRAFELRDRQMKSR